MAAVAADRSSSILYWLARHCCLSLDKRSSSHFSMIGASFLGTENIEILPSSQISIIMCDLNIIPGTRSSFMYHIETVVIDCADFTLQYVSW